MHLNKENILKSLSETAGVAAEAIPKPTPWLTIPFAWLQYVSGKVPYDFHEGKPILNQDDMRADIKYSIPKMVKHSLDQSGFWDLTNKKPTHNTLEGILSWTPLLSRFIIVTDAGLKKNETLDEYLRQRANVKEERAQARKTGTYL